MTLDALVKLGGSLLGGADLPALLRCLTELAKTRRLVAMPGGGPFADAVRRSTAVHDPGASASHWMAILAMDQHAHLLAGLLPEARLAAEPQQIEAVLAQGRLAVVAPYAWLRATDPLPHGWQVTSDSIAAWAAGQLGARRLVLLKAIEGVPDGNGSLAPEVERQAPALAGIVDDYFACALQSSLECWIVSGRHPERLTELLRDGATRGTRIR